MEDFKKVEDLVDHLKEYVHVRIDEARLGLAERSSGVISYLIVGVVLACIFVLGFVFVCLAGALLLGRLFNDLALGMLIVAAFLVIAGLIIRWGRERLIRIPIMNAMISELFKSDNGHEEN